MDYYYSSDATDMAALSEYFNLVYDAAGNLVTTDRFVINYNGKTTHCSHYEYNMYDNHINPLFTGDEVRTMQLSCVGTLNSSKNNATNAGGFTKIYDYRADGRPASCLVQQNGKNISRLIFEYQ